MLILFLGLVSVMTATLSAVIGIVGGTTLLAVMAAVLPWSIVIPIHGLTQLTSNFTRAFFLRTHIRKDIAIPFVIAVPVGALAAVYLIKRMESTVFPHILILLLISYVVFKPKKLPALKIPIKGFFLVGIAAGFLSLLIGATGPFLAPFFFRDDLSKEEIISTTAAAQVITHAAKIPSFLYLGFDYLAHLDLFAVLVVGTVIGTRFGVHLLNRVSEKVFRWLYRSALLLAGARILYKLFIN